MTKNNLLNTPYFTPPQHMLANNSTCTLWMIEIPSCPTQIIKETSHFSSFTESNKPTPPKNKQRSTRGGRAGRKKSQNLQFSITLVRSVTQLKIVTLFPTSLLFVSLQCNSHQDSSLTQYLHA